VSVVKGWKNSEGEFDGEKAGEIVPVQERILLAKRILDKALDRITALGFHTTVSTLEPLRKCERCNKDIPWSAPKLQRFCTGKCAHKAAEKRRYDLKMLKKYGTINPHLEPRECFHCGKMYELGSRKGHWLSLYCSPKCSQRANMERRFARKGIPPKAARPCALPGCPEMVSVAQRRGTMYHSKKCRDIAQYAKRFPPLEPKKCALPGCNGMLPLVRRRFMKYHSPECQLEASREACRQARKARASLPAPAEGVQSGGVREPREDVLCEEMQRGLGLDTL
jgi:hypothetical protein